IRFFTPAAARSRSVAKSGSMPKYQNTSEMIRYVLIANTSQTSGDRKFTHSGPREFGYGIIQNASHGRPMWMSGKRAAHRTAKMVIASADRLIDMRQCWRKSSRMAEMSVPDADPEHEVGDVERPADALVEPPRADARRNLVGHAGDAHRERGERHRDAYKPAGTGPCAQRHRDVVAYLPQRKGPFQPGRSQRHRSRALYSRRERSPRRAGHHRVRASRFRIFVK